MIGRLKRSWGRLRSDPPGERFERRYDRHHEEGTSALRRWGYIGLGVVVVAAGIFFLPAPGPGMVILALGAGLIAQEFRPIARALDWAELKIRPLVMWGRDVYQRASRLGRGLLAGFVVLLIAGAGFGAYQLFFAH